MHALLSEVFIRNLNIIEKITIKDTMIAKESGSNFNQFESIESDGRRETFRPLDPIGLIESWFDNGTRCVMFGYQHDVLDIHQYMGAVLVPELTRMGITTIFAEHSVTWQKDLDIFRKTGRYSAEWENEIGLVLGLSGGYEDARYLYEAVKDTPSLRLVFTDIPDDRKTGWPIRSAIDRDRYMFEVIRKHRPQGKFLVINGSGHTEKRHLKMTGKTGFPFFRSTYTGTLAGYLSGYTDGKIRSLCAFGGVDYKLYPLKQKFDTLPKGYPAFALDLAAERIDQDSIVKDYVYKHRKLDELFDALVFFPDAKF